MHVSVVSLHSKPFILWSLTQSTVYITAARFCRFFFVSVIQQASLTCWANKNLLPGTEPTIGVFATRYDLIVWRIERKSNKMGRSKAGWIQPIRLEGVISVLCGSQISLRVHYCKRDEVSDGKMSLYRECCFPNYTKSWWTNLLS